MPGPGPVKANELAAVDGPVPLAGVEELAGAAPAAAPPDGAPELEVGTGTNEMSTVPCLPPASPKSRVHEAPAAACAGVGGHG
jgi:hypothetical protein